MRISRSTGAGLAARQFVSSPGASIALALLVLLVSTTATATPRAMQALFTAGLQSEVAALTPAARDLMATDLGGPIIGPGAGTGMTSDIEAVLGEQYEVLEGLHASMPAALRRSVADPRFAFGYDPAVAPTFTSLDSRITANVLLTFDPWLTDHVRIVDGELPAAPQTDWPSGNTVDIAMSAAASAEMEWRIGEVRTLNAAGDSEARVRLSGTYEAVHPSDEFWQQVPVGLEPSAVTPGLGATVVTATVFAAAEGWPSFLRFEPTPRVHVWYPLLSSTVDAATSDDLAAALREFTKLAQLNYDNGFSEFGYYRADGEVVSPVISFGFTSNVTATIDREATRATVSTAVIAMAAAGPLGVVIAVLSLSVALLVRRRMDAVTIAAARGASRPRLRLTLAAEGLALGLPTAALGVAAGLLLTLGPVTPGSLLPLVVGLLPAVLLAARLPSPGAARSDLDARGAGRFRWILELVTVVLAVAGVVVLTQRGIAAGEAVAFDPLLIVTPLLLTLAACVVVLRLYPLPLALIARRAARSRGLVTALGSARGLRDQAAGLAPVLAMVVAVSITTFSAVLLSTTTAGIDEAASEQVGADVSVLQSQFPDDVREAIDELDGVVATAAIWTDDDRSVKFDDQELDAAVVVAETAALAEVQSGMRSGIHPAVSLSSLIDGRIPVLVSEKLAAALEGVTELRTARNDLIVVGTLPDDSPYTPRETWLLADSAFQEDMLGGVSPHLLLVEAAPGTDIAGVAPDAVVTSRADVAERLHSNPAIYGLSAALGIAIGLSALLCAAAIVLTLVLGARSRAHLLDVLRALGGSSRQERGLLGWEIAPTAVVALVVGIGLGIALPALVLEGIDLRQFTGGSTQPAIVIDPLVPALVAAGFVLIVLLATAAALLLSRPRASRGGMETDD